MKFLDRIKKRPPTNPVITDPPTEPWPDGATLQFGEWVKVLMPHETWVGFVCRARQGASEIEYQVWIIGGYVAGWLTADMMSRTESQAA